MAASEQEDLMARALDEWRLRRGTRTVNYRPEERGACVICVITHKSRFFTWTLTHPAFYIEAGQMCDSEVGMELADCPNPKVYVVKEYAPGEWTADDLYNEALACYNKQRNF